MTKTQATVYETIKQNPGIWPATIHQLTGVLEMHITNALLKLESQGLVRVEGARWFVA